MIRLRFRMRAMLCVALVLVVAGCNTKNIQNVSITSPSPLPESPTQPTPALPGVTDVVLNTTAVTISLNTCPGFVVIHADVRGNEVRDGAVLWNLTPQVNAFIVETSPNDVKIQVNAAGSWKLVATSRQDSNISRSVDISAVGACAGAPPPPPPPTPPPPPPPPPPPGPQARCVLEQALMPASGSGSVGTRFTVRAVWRSEGGASCPGWYFSSDPSKISVDANTGAAVSLAPGTVDLCGQPNQSMVDPRTCGRFTVTGPPPPPPPPPPPTLSFSCSPLNLTVGQSSTCGWSTTNVTSCVASDRWTGGRSASGSESVTPLSIGSNTYTLTCTGLGGPISRSVTITVNQAPPPPTPACTLTQPLTPSSGSGAANTTMSVQARWTSSGGASCPGWYFSSDPSRVGVNGSSGEVKFIFTGSATICAQPAVNVTQPTTCGTFITR